MSLIYAVGDVHGKRTVLREALTLLQAKLGPGDYTVFLGDYMDRGEDSRGVIDDLIAFRALYPDTVFLRGNHEDMFLKAYFDDDAGQWLRNGGVETLLSYGTLFTHLKPGWRSAIPLPHVGFIANTVLEHAAANHHFVHAGLRPGQENDATTEAVATRRDHDCLWIREPFLASTEDFGRLVVFGHTIQGMATEDEPATWRPLVMPNKVGLDTGAFLGGPLSVGSFNDAEGWRGGPHFTLYQV
jgi:serine/threonine protein phosphatase 1